MGRKKITDTQKIINMLQKLNKEDLLLISSQLDDLCKQKKYNLERNKLNTELDEKLLELKGRPTICPICGFEGTVIKNGHQTSSQRFLCKNCKSTFGYKENSIVKGTSWSLDTWAVIIHYFCNHQTIKNMTNILKDDYGLKYTEKVIFYNIHKIINLINAIPLKTISGTVIQIDETLFPECQKGKVKFLIDYETSEIRPERRYLKIKGSMSKYFAHVETAVDEKGYCVCKFLGLGNVTPPKLVTFFGDLINQNSTNEKILCSDGDNIYNYLCETNNLNHYVRNSDYLETIKGKSPNELEELYNENKLDRYETLDKTEKFDYTKLNEIKIDKHLSIARVNALHSNLKYIFMSIKKNVSTKYLASYMAFYTYLKNYKIKNNIENITMLEAKKILNELLSYESLEVSRKYIEETKFVEPVADKEIEKEYQQYLKENKSNKLLTNEIFEITTKKEFILALPLSMLKRIVSNNGAIKSGQWTKEGCCNYIFNLENFDDAFDKIYKGKYSVGNEKTRLDKVKSIYLKKNSE